MKSINTRTRGGKKTCADKRCTTYVIRRRDFAKPAVRDSGCGPFEKLYKILIDMSTLFQNRTFLTVWIKVRFTQLSGNYSPFMLVKGLISPLGLMPIIFSTATVTVVWSILSDGGDPSWHQQISTLRKPTSGCRTLSPAPNGQLSRNGAYTTPMVISLSCRGPSVYQHQSIWHGWLESH